MAGGLIGKMAKATRSAAKKENKTRRRQLAIMQNKHGTGTSKQQNKPVKKRTAKKNMKKLHELVTETVTGENVSKKTIKEQAKKAYRSQAAIDKKKRYKK